MVQCVKFLNHNRLEVIACWELSWHCEYEPWMTWLLCSCEHMSQGCLSLQGSLWDDFAACGCTRMHCIGQHSTSERTRPGAVEELTHGVNNICCFTFSWKFAHAVLKCLSQTTPVTKSESAPQSALVLLPFFSFFLITSFFTLSLAAITATWQTCCYERQ